MYKREATAHTAVEAAGNQTDQTLGSFPGGIVGSSLGAGESKKNLDQASFEKLI